jgi:hypothetical protein
MAINKTYKDGGSGKGQAVRLGLDLNKYAENLEKIQGTREPSCLDCKYFKGINVLDIVKCLDGKKNVGLKPCDDFIQK